MQKYKTVAEFIGSLDPDKKTQVEVLRSIITAHSDLQEHIKWNAPSYVLDGQDRLTFNVTNKEGVVKLILHMGATRTEDKKAVPVMSDESGLIEWSSDIRGILSFEDLNDITNKRAAVGEIINQWLLIQD